MTSAAPPRDWRSVPVSDLISISHGFAFRGEYFSEHGRDAVTTPGNFLESGGFRHTRTKQRYYSGSFLESYRLDAGDLIVAMTEQADGLLGSTAFVPGTGSWLHNQRIGRIRAKSDEVSLKYLYYAFNSFEFRKSVAETAVGTKVKHTSPTKLGAVEILLPPRDEQNRIAEKLDDADAMTLGLERLVAKKQAIKQGMMQQLLTGKTRLPGFTGRWHEARVLDLADGRRELFNDGDWIESPYITDSGDRLLQTGNVGVGRLLNRGMKRYISAESFRTLKCKEVVPGDILICRLADPAGRACLVPDIGERRMLTSVDVTLYRPDPHKADRRFLVAMFCIPEWFQEVSDRCGGSTRTRVARSELGKIKLWIPGVEEQRAIAEALSDAESEIETLRTRLIKARAIKTGMMQELLTGRTRLSVKEGTA